MSQAYVVREDLLVETTESPVRVIGWYPDEPILYDMLKHGDTCTKINVLDANIFYDSQKFRTTLKPEWRNDYKFTLNYEANRRITKVFPDYKQQNYTAAINEYITRYGSDTTAWPSEAQTIKAEGDRGWNYIKAVRASSNSWTSMPINPTDDSIWPAEIPPIQSPPSA